MLDFHLKGKHKNKSIANNYVALLRKDQTQVHCQKLHCIMKESYFELVFFIGKAQVHLQKQLCFIKEI